MNNLNNQTLKIYWKHAWKYKKQQVSFYSGLLSVQLVEDFLQTYIISIVITAIANNSISDYSSLKITLILLIIAATEMYGHFMMNFLVRRYWVTQDRVTRDLDMTVFNHLTKMSMDFYSNRFAGSIVSQTNKFVGSFERLQDSLTWNVYKLIVSVLATTTILWFEAPLISIVMIVITAIFVPLVWYFRKNQLPLATKLSESESARTGQLSDTVSNILAVKSYANEQLEEKMMLTRLNTVFNNSKKLMKLTMKQEFVQGLLQRNLLVIVVIIAVLLARNGELEVGIIYLVLTLTLQIMRRLWDLNSTFRNVTRIFGDASDMTKILAIKPGIKLHNKNVPFASAEGSIEFRNVSFAYEDQPDEIVLKNFNQTILPGTSIGLVGHSGSGKTTLTKLLLHFMETTSGEIIIDGSNIKDVDQSILHRHISYVPQEPLLFHRSLRENISYGSPHASESEITTVAKKAHAHEFIDKLPDGYNTLVGERGVKLSGGQKQRIAIARAMLKDAPILLLDEATSALDSESEQLIQEALWKLMEGKTAIVIAHRLSTIQKMDRILVLEDGKIIEDGSHAVLLKKKGQYAKLWKHQSGGFLQD